jgi:hypothetical protein
MPYLDSDRHQRIVAPYSLEFSGFPPARRSPVFRLPALPRTLLQAHTRGRTRPNEGTYDP